MKDDRQWKYLTKMGGRKFTLAMIASSQMFIVIIGSFVLAYKNKDTGALIAIAGFLTGVITAYIGGNVIQKYKEKTTEE